MLSGLTAAEAVAQTVYLIEQEADAQLWAVWLTDRGAHLTAGVEHQTFEQFKRGAQERAAEAVKPRARALRPGEEAERLAWASQFVKIKEG